MGWHSRFYGYGFCYVFTTECQRRQPFNNAMHLHQDYDFVLKAAVNAHATCVAFDDDLDEPAAVHIRHEGSSTDCPQQVPVRAPAGFPEAPLRRLLDDRRASHRLTRTDDDDDDDDEYDDDRLFRDDDEAALFAAAGQCAGDVLGPIGCGDFDGSATAAEGEGYWQE